jgi:hypothetical protein
MSPELRRQSTQWPCPKCGAEVGAPCRSRETSNPVQYPHSGRRNPDPATPPPPLPPATERPRLQDSFSAKTIRQQTWCSILESQGKGD